MIDWHCHILPGVDDGAADIEQSTAMAAALSEAGYTTVYCTPHQMRGCYEVGNDRIRQGVAELQERLDSCGIPLNLLPGREYCLDEYLLPALEDPLTLGESRQVLIEILPHATADMVRQLLYGVVRSGLTPVIAHPERCQLLAPVVPRGRSRGLLGTIKSLLAGGRSGRQQSCPSDTTGNALLDYLRDLGCCFQGNLGSFSGYYGRQVLDAALSMKAIGLYDRFGSDLHTPEQAGLILMDGRRP